MREQVNIVGNVYDKYGSGNPIARRLMAGFLRDVGELFASVSARSVLEVGCGEGHLSDTLARVGPRPDLMVAVDLAVDQFDPDVHASVRHHAASAYELPYGDDSFDLVVICEVLEHLERPGKALAEVCRVARRAVLLSVPWEPLWRIMNLARLKYVAALGNTPGHIQHFTRRGILRLARSRLAVTALRKPVPWTIVLGDPRA